MLPTSSAWLWNLPPTLTPIMTLNHYSLFAVLVGAALMLGIVFFLLKRKGGLKPAAILSSPQPAPIKFKDIAVRAGFTPDVVLHVAASLAQASDTPVYRAIVTEVKERKLPIKAVEEFKALAGYGLTGLVDGRIIALGSHILMTELGIDIKVNPAEFQASQSAGTEVIYISINSYLAGIITINTLPA